MIETQRNAVHVMHEYAKRNAVAHIRIDAGDMTWERLQTLLSATSNRDFVREAYLWATLPVRISEIHVVSPHNMPGANAVMQIAFACLPAKIRKRVFITT
jgi:hypothetical protein